MPEHAIVTLGELDSGLVLTPERYDPRRRPDSITGPRIGDIADVFGQQTSAKTASANAQYLVLDTGDAREGAILTRKPLVPGAELGSSKKRVQAGDVIVSRLRPYLRQIAYVDKALAPEGAEVVCSTEFYVLRSRGRESIAFLVPLLLSHPAQRVLGASQEGGHHPRFNLSTLEGIQVPDAIMRRRKELSRAVVKAVKSARLSELTMRELVQSVDDGSA